MKKRGTTSPSFFICNAKNNSSMSLLQVQVILHRRNSMMRKIGKLAVAVLLGVAMMSNALASSTDKQCVSAKEVAEAISDSREEVREDLIRTTTIIVAAAPVSIPSEILAFPYQSMKIGYKESKNIKNEAGRNLLRFAMAPWWIPAAILNIPSGILSFTGLTQGY
jgi:hypothetical protein